MTYYNTTHETGPTLASYMATAAAQERKILRFMCQYHYKSFAPSEVWREAFYMQSPITSVRRAMTNLTQAGALVKLDQKRRGYYGRPEHLWKLHESILTSLEVKP